MRKTFHLSEIENYAHCPARYYYEHKLNRGLETRVLFDLKRRIFKEFFRLQDKQRKNYAKLDLYVREYSDQLRLNKTKLSADLIAGYTQKAYEALWLTFTGRDVTVTVPKTLYFEINNSVIGIDIDAIFMERGYIPTHKIGKTKSENPTNTTVYFCILVSTDKWESIDLSNRFENIICKKYIFPNLIAKKNDLVMKMLYFCPDNGRSFTIDNIDISTSSQVEARMQYLIKQMQDKVFFKNPRHCNCSVCPVKQDCYPADNRIKHSTQNEAIVIAPLDEQIRY